MKDRPTFTPSEEAALDVLEMRVLVAFTYPHGHPGVAGVEEGAGCPRCNAEKALREILRRAETMGAMTATDLAGDDT